MLNDDDQLIPFLAALCCALAIALTAVWFLPQPQHWTFQSLDKTYETLFLMLLWVLVSGSVIVNGTRRRFNQRKEEAAQQEIWDAKGRNESSSEATKLKPIINEARAYREAQQRENQRRYFGETVTFLILIAAAFIGILQWRILTRTDETEKITNRAFVYAVPGPIFNLTSDIGGPKLESRVIINNSGRTYAKNVKRWAAMIVKPPLRFEELQSLGSGDAEHGILVVAPNAPHNFIRRLDSLGKTIANDIIHEHQSIYVYGRIEYIDGFDESRWTDFCFRYSGEVTVWPKEHGGPGYDGSQAKYCEAHNDAN